MPDSFSNVLHDVKISELPAADQANATDQLEANQDGTTRRITIDQIRAAVQEGGILSADSLADLKLLPPTADVTVVTAYRNTVGDRGGGMWTFLPGDQTAKVTLDPLSIIYAAPDSDPTCALGVWQREFDGPINVKWTDQNTAGYQAAIALCENMISALYRCLYWPAGNYYTDPLVINKPMTIKGESRMATHIRLNVNVGGAPYVGPPYPYPPPVGEVRNTGPLFTVNFYNAPGSADDLEHAVFEDIHILGNRLTEVYFVGTDPTWVIPNNSHGIYCPYPGYPTTGGYGSSLACTDVNVENFTGDGIQLGSNRNGAQLVSVYSRYNMRNGVLSGGFDHVVTECSIGSNGSYGWQASGGGGIEISNTTIFFNYKAGICINAGMNHTYHFTNGCCDWNGEEGALIAAADQKSQITFTNWRFNDNSQWSPASVPPYATPATLGDKSHIRIANTPRVAIVGCQFLAQANQPKYLVETSGTVESVQWVGNTFSSSALLPYNTLPFNDIDKINIDSNYMSLAQVRFPATAVPSTYANTLDDYEEGTWTPIIDTVTPGTGASYPVQVGGYTKIGNLVTVQWRLAMTTHTGSGGMRISGLPFTPTATANMYAGGSVGSCDSMALTASNALILVVVPSSPLIHFYQYPIGGGVNVVVPKDDNFTVAGSVTYRTAI